MATKASSDQKIRDILVKKSERFRDLSIKHREYDLRLKELERRIDRSDNEQLEVRKLKKQKLQLKDSMQKYIFEYRKNAPQ